MKRVKSLTIIGTTGPVPVEAQPLHHLHFEITSGNALLIRELQDVDIKGTTATVILAYNTDAWQEISKIEYKSISNARSTPS